MSTFVIMPSDSFKDIMFTIRVNLESIGFNGLESKPGMIIPENTAKTPLI